jgi:2-polyprenyl-6-methoxyphenol hydroxylase-like FAD-dependent oxidoreductase
MTEHAVVIAGGGPTGLMLAGELALAGVDVAVVERRERQDVASARRRPALTHDRGIRSAGNRRAFPFARAGWSGRGLLVHPSRHQRLSHSPQLRDRALSGAHRAHHGRLGRRAAGEALSRA